jgi:hypothetical protein
MGYYTCFSLSLSTVDGTEIENDTDIIADFKERCEYADCALDFQGGCNEPQKWYDCDDDLKEFSKNYPEVLFVMHGEGDGNEDLWNLYVLNGKAQYAGAEITYPEFDPALLEE